MLLRFCISADNDNGCLFLNCKINYPRPTIQKLESCSIHHHSLKKNLKEIKCLILDKYQANQMHIKDVYNTISIATRFLSRFHHNWGINSNSRLELLS